MCKEMIVRTVHGNEWLTTTPSAGIDVTVQTTVVMF